MYILVVTLGFKEINWYHVQFIWRINHMISTFCGVVQIDFNIFLRDRLWISSWIKSISNELEAFMFSLICASTNGWANNRDAGDLRRHRAHYDIGVMLPDADFVYNKTDSMLSTFSTENNNECRFSKTNLQLFSSGNASVMCSFP